MRSHLVKGFKIALFFGVGIIILNLVYQRQDAAYQAECALKGIPAADCNLMVKIVADISNANYFWVMVIMILFMVSNVLRALRWKMMFKAIGYQPKMINLLGTIMINYLANLGIPRSGEVIRAGLLSGYENIPVEKVLGTIFTDRIFDVFMLGFVMILAVIIGGDDFIVYLNQNIDLEDKLASLYNNTFLLIGLISGFIISLFLAWKFRTKLYHSSLGRKLVSLFEGFGVGVQSVRKVSSIPLFLFHTVMIWVIYYLMMYLSFFTFLPTSGLGPTEGLIVFAFGSLGILIPTPGGMGSYHYLVGEALAMYGISGADAFSFANIVFFSIQIFVNIVFGAISLILLPILNKE